MLTSSYVAKLVLGGWISGVVVLDWCWVARLVVRWLWISVWVAGSVVDRSFVARSVVGWSDRWWINVL